MSDSSSKKLTEHETKPRYYEKNTVLVLESNILPQRNDIIFFNAACKSSTVTVSWNLQCKVKYRIMKGKHSGRHFDCDLILDSIKAGASYWKSDTQNFNVFRAHNWYFQYLASYFYIQRVLKNLEFTRFINSNCSCVCSVQKVNTKQIDSKNFKRRSKL